MNMVRNNLNRKENIHRANQFVKSIDKYPIELLRIQYMFDACNSRIEEFGNKELDAILSTTFGIFKNIFGKKNGKLQVVLFPSFDWDSDQFCHQIGINFVITGVNLDVHTKELNLKIGQFVTEYIGGDYRIEYIHENSPEDVFLEIFPVQFESVLKDAEFFFTSSEYPKFYSRTLFDFLTSPIQPLELKD
jgi:hypothetical protein